MGLWMSAKTVLQRVVEDEKAPVMTRVRALQEVQHPELAMLRRLLVDTKTRTKPVPAKLKALASLRYVQELSLRKLRKEQKTAQHKTDNALGI